ncbi:Sec-independent protein translocase subunit TatA [Georgenia satyanarayanai]|uniref:Sec-independent protein translocase subunit TatA n=1 Tax=Georgenia satyanarayanai TaxID=860221 RepID=UPI00203BC0AA|nr:Sec-independent protein translocase subunit TatA [Georgenia satyanarayanai]MCM3662445.1 Sec-independent protein translocase subunit TatA [Georgenia satyanarayanai]
MRPTHILILLIVLVILFGAKRLPDVARSVGQSMKVFKKEISELQEDVVVPAAPVTATQATMPAPAPVAPAAGETAPTDR